MASAATVDTTKVIASTAAPSLAPDRQLDLDHLDLDHLDLDHLDLNHLESFSHGDPDTMRQMLRLFNIQSEFLLARIAGEAPKAAAASAHALAVSARSIGAWKVAECAKDFESIALGSGQIALSVCLRRLSTEVTEAQAEISSFLLDTAQQRLRRRSCSFAK